MSRQADCPSCLTGIHEGHDPKWNIRECLIGGEYCGCSGDCAERAKAAFDNAWATVFPPEIPSTSPAPECHACRVLACEVEGNTAGPHTCTTRPVPSIAEGDVFGDTIRDLLSEVICYEKHHQREPRGACPNCRSRAGTIHAPYVIPAVRAVATRPARAEGGER